MMTTKKKETKAAREARLQKQREEDIKIAYGSVVHKLCANAGFDRMQGTLKLSDEARAALYTAMANGEVWNLLQETAHRISSAQDWQKHYEDLRKEFESYRKGVRDASGARTDFVPPYYRGPFG